MIFFTKNQIKIAMILIGQPYFNTDNFIMHLMLSSHPAIVSGRRLPATSLSAHHA